MKIFLFFLIIAVVICSKEWDEILQKVIDQSPISIKDARKLVSSAQRTKFNHRYVNLPTTILSQFSIDFYTVENHLLISNLLNLEFILSVLENAVTNASRQIHPTIPNFFFSLLDEKYKLRQRVNQIALSFYEKTPNDPTIRFLHEIEPESNFASIEYELLERSKLTSDSNSIFNEVFTVRSQNIDNAKQVLYYAYKVAVPSKELLMNFTVFCRQNLSVVREFNAISNGSHLGKYYIFNFCVLINGLFGFVPAEFTNESFVNVFESLNVDFEKFSCFNQILVLFAFNWELLLAEKRLLSSEIFPNTTCASCQSIMHQIALYFECDENTLLESDMKKCPKYDSIKRTFFDSKKMTFFKRQFNLFLESLVSHFQSKENEHCNSRREKIYFQLEMNRKIFAFRKKIESTFNVVDGVFSPKSILALFRKKFSNVRPFDLIDVELSHNHSIPAIVYDKSHNVPTSFNSIKNSEVTISNELLLLNGLWNSIESEVVKQCAFEVYCELSLRNSSSKSTQRNILLLSFYLMIQQNLNLKIFYEQNSGNAVSLAIVCEIFVNAAKCLWKIFMPVRFSSKYEANLGPIPFQIFLHLNNFFKGKGNYSTYNLELTLTKSQLTEIVDYLTRVNAFSVNFE